jgi:hypothetical protein
MGCKECRDRSIHVFPSWRFELDVGVYIVPPLFYSSSYYTPHHFHSLLINTLTFNLEMTPYYHQSTISTPPTPREGNTFPPLRSSLPGHNHIVKREPFEEGAGPFDEDDIELQLSSHSRSRLELGLRVLKYLTIVLLGLVIIGTSLHISNVLYQT